MPCDSEYLNANESEIEHQHAANLLIYIASFSKGVVAPWIVGESKNQYANDKRLIPLLCAELTKLKARPGAFDRIVYNAKDKTSRDLADWWERHKEADREREKREKEKRANKKLAEKALSKLSDKEKKVLGIHLDDQDDEEPEE